MGSARRTFLSAGIVALALFFATETMAFRTPEALIRAIYLPLLDDTAPLPAPIRIYGADTLGLIRTFQGHNSGGLGFLPFVDGQNVDIAAFSARQIRLDGVSAEIVVKFTNFGEPNRLNYSLVREIDGWRIHDISGMWASGPWSVRELLVADPSRLGLAEAMASP